MAIHIDVVADYDRRAARTAAQDLQKEFSSAGQNASKAFSSGFATEAPKVEKALNRAADSQGKLNIETEKYNRLVASGDADRVKLISQYERMTKAHRDNESAIRNATREFQNLGSTASTAGMSLTEMGASLGALGRMATPAAVVGLVAVVTQLTGVASAAAGAIGLLPGAIGGVASAFGTLKLATLGFGEAIESIQDPEKFAEALQQLSPAAQQAALSIQQLMPAFTQLKNATQDAFFAGVGPQLTQLTNQFMPTIQQATTGIAGAFNQGFMAVSQQLMTPETQASIKTFVDNLVEAFRQLAPAAAPLTKAFADIMAVGSGFLPELAKGATDAATAFSQFIAEARQSGLLQEWIGTGLNTLKQMLPIVRDVGEMFLRLAPVGERIMPDIVLAIDQMSKLLPPLLDGISRFPSAWQGVARAIDFATKALTPFATMLSTILDAFGLLGSKEEQAQRKLASAQLRAALGGAPGGPGGYTAGGSFATPASGNLPVPGGPPGIGSGFQGGSASARIQPYTWGNPPPKASSTGGGPNAPVLPYDTTLPPEMAQLPQTAEIIGAENSWLDARHSLAEKQALVQQLERDNTATESARVSAANQVIQAQQAQNEALLRVNTAAQNLYEKNNKQLRGFADQMGEIGAKLDQDLGISKGLPGIAENLFKFLANLAAAPLEGQLNALSNAPGQAQGGFGLIGMLGAQGAFGPQYTFAGQQAAANQNQSALGPAALQPGVPYGGGAYPGDAALLANVPAGRYSQDPSRDLLKGLSDCSSSVGDLVTLLDSGTTAGPNLTTGNADQWLPAHGFLPGMGGLGDFRVGFNSGHMQATLPGGTPWNWGSNEAAARRGIGGTGADDPAFTSHYYRPAGAGPVGGPTAGSDGASLFPGQLPSSPAPSGGFGAGIPIPLPVTIVGGMGGGALPMPGAPAPGVPGTPAAPGASPAPGTTGPTDLYGPANTNPGLNNPPAPGTPGWTNPGLPGIPAGGGGGSGFMGLGGPGLGAGVPAQGPAIGATRIGGVDPLQGTGKGGFGMSEGGSLDTAMGLAASAFPGMGQAAQTGMKLANRAIQYGGQVAGIMTQGALDTWLPFGGSKLAQDGWLTRIVGGLAGAAPALPNIAGKGTQQQQDPNAPQQPGNMAQAGQQITNNLTVNNQRQTEDGTGKDLTRHLNNMYAPAAMP